MTSGCDYAWGRPSIAALKAAGVRFVCRYLSHDSTGKNLDHVRVLVAELHGQLAPPPEGTSP